MADIRARFQQGTANVRLDGIDDPQGNNEATNKVYVDNEISDQTLEQHSDVSIHATVSETDPIAQRSASDTLITEISSVSYEVSNADNPARFNLNYNDGFENNSAFTTFFSPRTDNPNRSNRTDPFFIRVIELTSDMDSSNDQVDIKVSINRIFDSTVLLDVLQGDISSLGDITNQNQDLPAMHVNAFFGNVSTTSSGATDGQVLVWRGSHWTNETPQAGSEITIQDEGTALVQAATTLNFTGDGVTASGNGGVKTINIPGGVASGSSLPSTGTAGDIFVLTADAGANFAGIYFYNGTTWEHSSAIDDILLTQLESDLSDINVNKGTTLPTATLLAEPNLFALTAVDGSNQPGWYFSNSTTTTPSWTMVGTGGMGTVINHGATGNNPISRITGGNYNANTDVLEIYPVPTTGSPQTSWDSYATEDYVNNDRFNFTAGREINWSEEETVEGVPTDVPYEGDVFIVDTESQGAAITNSFRIAQSTQFATNRQVTFTIANDLDHRRNFIAASTVGTRLVWHADNGSEFIIGRVISTSFNTQTQRQFVNLEIEGRVSDNGRFTGTRVASGIIRNADGTTSTATLPNLTYPTGSLIHFGVLENVQRPIESAQLTMDIDTVENDVANNTNQIHVNSIQIAGQAGELARINARIDAIPAQRQEDEVFARQGSSTEVYNINVDRNFTKLSIESVPGILENVAVDSVLTSDVLDLTDTEQNLNTVNLRPSTSSNAVSTQFRNLLNDLTQNSGVDQIAFETNHCYGLELLESHQATPETFPTRQFQLHNVPSTGIPLDTLLSITIDGLPRAGLEPPIINATTAQRLNGTGNLFPSTTTPITTPTQLANALNIRTRDNTALTFPDAVTQLQVGRRYRVAIAADGEDFSASGEDYVGSRALNNVTAGDTFTATAATMVTSGHVTQILWSWEGHTLANGDWLITATYHADPRTDDNGISLLNSAGPSVRLISDANFNFVSTQGQSFPSLRGYVPAGRTDVVNYGWLGTVNSVQNQDLTNHQLLFMRVTGTSLGNIGISSGVPQAEFLNDNIETANIVVPTNRNYAIRITDYGTYDGSTSGEITPVELAEANTNSLNDRQSGIITRLASSSSGDFLTDFTTAEAFRYYRISASPNLFVHVLDVQQAGSGRFQLTLDMNHVLTVDSPTTNADGDITGNVHGYSSHFINEMRGNFPLFVYEANPEGAAGGGLTRTQVDGRINNLAVLNTELRVTDNETTTEVRARADNTALELQDELILTTQVLHRIEHPFTSGITAGDNPARLVITFTGFTELNAPITTAQIAYRVPRDDDTGVVSFSAQPSGTFNNRAEVIAAIVAEMNTQINGVMAASWTASSDNVDTDNPQIILTYSGANPGTVFTQTASVLSTTIPGTQSNVFTNGTTNAIITATITITPTGGNPIVNMRTFNTNQTATQLAAALAMEIFTDYTLTSNAGTLIVEHNVVGEFTLSITFSSGAPSVGSQVVRTSSVPGATFDRRPRVLSGNETIELSTVSVNTLPVGTGELIEIVIDGTPVDVLSGNLFEWVKHQPYSSEPEFDSNGLPERIRYHSAPTDGIVVFTVLPVFVNGLPSVVRMFSGDVAVGTTSGAIQTLTLEFQNGLPTGRQRLT